LNIDVHKINVNHHHPSNFSLVRHPPRMPRTVPTSTRNYSQFKSFNSLPHRPVAERRKPSPKPLFAEKVSLTNARLNANSAP